MDPFVLVHGAWHGAWCWDATIAALNERGHLACAPELRGSNGEPDAPPITLADHVTDVVSAISSLDLIDVTLVGTNYSAALLPLIFEEIPNRIDGMIFIDGLIPLSGESVAEVAEIVMPQAQQAWEHAATDSGFKNLPPDESILSWMLADIPDDARADVLSKMRPHPYPTLVEKVHYQTFPSAPPYRAYVRCQRTPFRNTGARMAERAKAHLYPLSAGHDAMLTHPEVLANRMLEIVDTWNAGDTP